MERKRQELLSFRKQLIDDQCLKWTLLVLIGMDFVPRGKEEQKVFDILFDSSDGCDLCFVLLNSCRACDYFIIIRLEYQLKQDF